MVQKNFNRFGLRRDFNLADLTSPTTALNNILNTPSMLGTEASFTINDLNPIFGISFTNISLSTFQGLNNITVEFTVIDEDGFITDESKVYLPLIKIKTQLDSSFFSAGEPFFFGGDGPDAIYYDARNIIRDPEDLILFEEYDPGQIVLSNNILWRSKIGAIASEPLTSQNAESFNFEFVRFWGGLQDIYFNDEFDVITGEVITISDNFWERGQFAYTGKLQASFLSLFGGVNWKGFYKPSNSGEVDFQIRTTGSCIFKFQAADELPNQLVRYGRVPQSEIDYFQDYIDNPFTLGYDQTFPGLFGPGRKYSLSNILQIVEAYNDPTRQLVKVSLPKAQKVRHNDLIFLEVAEGQLKSKRYRVLTHRNGSAANPIRNEPDETEVIFFYIEVTEDFNLLNLDASTLDAPSTGSNESFFTGTIIEAPQNASLAGLLATYRYGPYERRQLKTYFNSIYHKLRIPESEWDYDASQPNRIYFNGTNDQFYGLHFTNEDYIYDYRRYPSDPEPLARRWIISSSFVAIDNNPVTYNSVRTGQQETANAYANLTLDTSYFPVGFDSNVNDQFAYYIASGTPVTANYGNTSNPIWDNKSGNVTMDGDVTRNVRIRVYDPNTGSYPVTNISNQTSADGGIYTSEYAPGGVGANSIVFETGKKYILYADQTNSLDRQINFVFRGASGGGQVVSDPDGNLPDAFTGGYGGYIAGTFTLRRDVFYALIIGSQGELNGQTSEFGGRGASGISDGAAPEQSYSGGGFTGLFDLDLSVSNGFAAADAVPLTTDNVVVIAGGGGGASHTYGWYENEGLQKGGSGGGAFGSPNGGAANTSGGGSGASQLQGGNSGGGTSSEGLALQGGAGGDTSIYNNPGGGGGGGFYGGGGGRQENASTTDETIKSQGGGGGSSVFISGTEQVTLDQIPGSFEIGIGGTSGNFTTGPISASDESSTVIFVARHGEEIPRIKTITIDHFLSEFDDYAIDWTYYTKDEDISPTTDYKYWYIRKKDTQQQFYSSFSYKFLYGRDYEFYEIGDFKQFIDNAVQSYGTSREVGIKQLAFGRPQLISKGDQYNILYSLFPIQSVYQTKLNWFLTVKQGTCQLRPDSRLLIADNATNFALGNYVVEDTIDAFKENSSVQSAFDAGTRVIETQTSGSNNNIIISKAARATGSNIPYCAIDHRGFVTTCVLTSGSNGILFEGDISEVKVGMNVCVQVDSTRTTYLRISKIEQISGSNYVTLDSSINNVPAAREPATGGFTPTNVTQTPQNTSQYGWFKKWDLTGGSASTERIETPWKDSRETRIRWNNVTVYNETNNSSGGIIRVEGTGLQDADGNTYYPYLNPEDDLFSAFVGQSTGNRESDGSGWGTDRVSSFNVFRLQAGTPLKAIVYNDKGIDIQEPLRQFCTNTICTQNNFTIETESTKTNYIMVRIKDFYGDTTLPYADLDQYFLNSGLGVSTTGSYNFDLTGANPQRKYGIAAQNSTPATWQDFPASFQQGEAGVAWWADAYTNSVDIRHGYQNGAGTITLNGIQGSKRLGGNHIYARVSGSQLETALLEQGFDNFPFDDYTPIGTIEGICRINKEPWTGDGTFGDTKYYLIVRVNENHMVWGETEVLQDGSTERYKTLNLQEYESTLFNMTDWAISNDWNTMFPTGNVTTPNLANGYFVSTLSELRQLFEAANSAGAVGFEDRIFQITSDITITPTSSFSFEPVGGVVLNILDFDMFYDVTGSGNAPEKAFARNVAGSETAVEYVLPQGSIIRIFGNSAQFLWYASADQIQHTSSLYTYPPQSGDGVEEYWTLTPTEAIQSAINNFPTKQLNTTSTNGLNWSGVNPSTNGNQYRFLHYRSNIYEVLPTPDWASQRFPGLRLINPTAPATVFVSPDTIPIATELQNTTNKLSVYTYAATASNRELCCPPLDTSPPFDSSPIGLSTTSLNPDMYIDGLVNVRSISANHPPEKFYSTVGLSNDTLPVTDKLELLFGNTKYKLLMGDTNPGDL